jgi:hypothetical protein
MSFRVGIDIDNTILSYQKLFHSLAVEKKWISPSCVPFKKNIKQSLLTESGDEGLAEQRWQQLQAWAYGPCIDRAIIFNGFREFLLKSRRDNDILFIVSHKTEFSNFDPGVNLRQSALKTLEVRGFFDSLENGGLGFSYEDIIFASSLKEKVSEIRGLNLTHFVDDLRKVLDNPEFPQKTQRIWFNGSYERNCDPESLGSWLEISDYFKLCHQLEKRPIAPLGPPITLGGAGNNRVKKFQGFDKKFYILKEYSQEDPRSKERSAVEFNHLNALWGLGFRNIPKPFFYDVRFSVYSYIEGQTIKEVGRNEMDQLVSFIAELDQARPLLSKKTIKNASDARFCLKDYVDAIDRRLNEIMSGCECHSWGLKISRFLTEDFMPLKKWVIDRFIEFIDLEGLDSSRRLEVHEQIFSPSDFGFHNIKRDKDGRLIFFDFEYSGWDDPAKLVADFFHHAAQDINWGVKWGVLDRMANHFSEDSLFLKRWHSIIDLVGLEWVLIILNIAKLSEMKRKRFSNPDIDEEGLVDVRLARASQRVGNMISRMKNNLSPISIFSLDEVRRGAL